MNIKENEILAPYTTFKIGGPARYFCVASNQKNLEEAALFTEEKDLQMLLLGGGSNMLISDKGFDGLAIVMDLKGYEVQENKNEIILKVASGENWDGIVDLAVKSGWWGIENLSHIPGKTGAIAVQNVGAYGQEASHVIEEVVALDLQTKETKHFSNADCNFAYRSSIFNGSSKSRYAILSTSFKLSKIPNPILWYRDLNLMFAGKAPALAEIRQAVINIRNKKFPFPVKAKNGNAGSFFKNPVISSEQYQQLKSKIAANLGADKLELLHSKSHKIEFTHKIPAALLLDICGLKGVNHKGAAINPNQPLVIINASGKAMASDVLELAAKVLATVKHKTGLSLQIEPELIGFSAKDLNGFGL